jgi:hypothetical protein
MSWFYSKQPDGRRPRRTGFVGTLTQARRAKAVELPPGREDRAKQERRRDVPTLYEFTKERLGAAFTAGGQSRDRYENAYRLRIHDSLGAYFLDELTRKDIIEWWEALVAREGDRHCAAYARKTLRWLLRKAVDQEHIERSPAEGIDFADRAKLAVKNGAASKRNHANKRAPLTRDQYDTLKTRCAQVSLSDLLKVRLAVEGCMGRAELAGLRGAGFQPDRSVFGLTNGVTYARDTGLTLGDLKNDNRYREVVLADDLRDLIVRYFDERDNHARAGSIHSRASTRTASASGSQR